MEFINKYILNNQLSGGGFPSSFFFDTDIVGIAVRGQ